VIVNVVTTNVVVNTDTLFTLGASLVIWFLWTDNFLRCLHLWNEHPGSRTFRSFLIALLLELGAIAFLFGALAYMSPQFVPVSRFFGLMVRGALLVVGLFTYITWRRK